MRKRKQVLAAGLIFTIAFSILPVSKAAPYSKTEYTYTGLGNKVRKEDEMLTRKYEKGITMLPEQVKARKERVESLGLEKEVDKDYFLPKEYYSRFSVNELEQKGMTILIKCMTQKDIARWEKRVRSGISPFYITRGNELISWTNSAGITTRTYAFDVDGNIAFCGDHGKTAPATGTPHSAYIPVTNKDLVKVLYYGYGGPKDEMTKLGYSKAKSYVIMAMLASNLRRGKPLGANGRVFWDHIKNFPDPPSYMGGAYYVDTGKEELQDLFFYQENKKGKLQITKRSKDPSLTDKNAEYHLEGAQYGIYKDAAATQEVAVLTTDKNGKTQEIELEKGNYYVKEKVPPKGFLKDETVYPVSITVEKKCMPVYLDAPKLQDIKVLIQKEDVEKCGLSMKGAEFQISYFKEMCKEDPLKKGLVPERQWTFLTDEKGQCLYKKEYQIKGDPLYPFLPYGTIRIEEVKAPDGYHLNKTIFVKQIKEADDASSILLKQGVHVPEKSRKILLLKVSEDGKKELEGARFEHTMPDGKKEIVETDHQGRLIIKGICRGTHELKEVEAPEGYEKNQNIIRFTVGENNEITKDFQIDPGLGSLEFAQDGEGNIVICMEDKVTPYDLVLLKKSDKGAVLKDAEFTLYQDKECTRQLKREVTDENGILKIKGLRLKTSYYLKETKAPQGYRKDDRVYEICHDTLPKDGVWSMTVINKTSSMLPDTGKSSMLFIICIGYAMMAIWFSKRKAGKKI